MGVLSRGRLHAGYYRTQKAPYDVEITMEIPARFSPCITIRAMKLDGKRDAAG